MALGYYNGFPATYAPVAQQPMQTTMQQPTSPLIWVQGIEAAKAYPVAPNATVQLWDSERSSVYLKSADSSGMPTLRIFDLVEKTHAAIGAEISTDERLKNYVTREEFEELKKALIKPMEVNDE